MVLISTGWNTRGVCRRGNAAGTAGGGRRDGVPGRRGELDEVSALAEVSVRPEPES